MAIVPRRYTNSPPPSRQDDAVAREDRPAQAVEVGARGEVVGDRHGVAQPGLLELVLAAQHLEVGRLAELEALLLGGDVLLGEPDRLVAERDAGERRPRALHGPGRAHG